MADVITGLYDFTLPEVGASDDTWGTKLNANWQKMEDLLAGTFTAGTPTSLGQQFRLNAGGAGNLVEIALINPLDPLAQVIRFGRSSPVGNLSMVLYNPGTTTARVQLKSEGTGSVEAGLGSFGEYYIGGLNDGSVNAGYISRTSGTIAMRGGTASTGVTLQVRGNDGIITGQVEAVGAAAPPNSYSIITKEKGDARYLNLAGSQTITGTNVIENTSPMLRFHETDAVSPGGQYAFGGGSAGDFFLWRFSAANFATSVILWSYDLGLNRFNFTPPVLFSSTVEVTTSVETPKVFSGNQSFASAGDVSGYNLEQSLFQLHPRDGLSSSGVALGIYRAGATVFYVNRSGSVVTTGSLNGDTLNIDKGINGAWLNVSGTISFPGVYAKTTATAANQYINTLFELYRSTSSGKFKTARTAIPNPGAIIDALIPLSFQSTHEVDEGRRFTGFISEDVTAAFPEASADNGENYDVRALVAVLWAELKLVRSRLAELEAA